MPGICDEEECDDDPRSCTAGVTFFFQVRDLPAAGFVQVGWVPLPFSPSTVTNFWSRDPSKPDWEQLDFIPDGEDEDDGLDGGDGRQEGEMPYSKGCGDLPIACAFFVPLSWGLDDPNAEHECKCTAKTESIAHTPLPEEISNCGMTIKKADHGKCKIPGSIDKPSECNVKKDCEFTVFFHMTHLDEEGHDVARVATPDDEGSNSRIPSSRTGTGTSRRPRAQRHDRMRVRRPRLRDRYLRLRLGLHGHPDLRGAELRLGQLKSARSAPPGQVLIAAAKIGVGGGEIESNKTATDEVSSCICAAHFFAGMSTVIIDGNRSVADTA